MPGVRASKDKETHKETMKVTPINMAEAIFEPFWDPDLSGLPEWQIADGSGHGLQVSQYWCFVNVEWTRKPAHGPALHMQRQCDIDCTGYDHLVVSVMAPETSIFRLTAQTDRGVVSFTAPPAPTLKKEHAIDLQGSSRIATLTLELVAVAEGPAAGWINWIGLQNAQLLPRYLAQFERFDDAWQGYLKPESYEPTFEPTLGILINGAELERMRSDHNRLLQERGTSPYVTAADAAAQRIPEQRIADFVNFWNDTRYNREREHDRDLLRHGPNAAIAGLLLKDKKLLRLAARYAMSIAMCEHWDDGMICYFPGSNFEHRCFVQSLCVHDVSLILDLAGEMFTDLGREYLLRRIAEEGLGNINFVTWKHEYIFHMNQLAWFTPGRILGYLTLERYWKHVTPFTEIAYQDLLENLSDSVLPDGGYVEGPTYFRCVARDGGLSLYYYARGRGLDFATILPDSMKRTPPFAEALVSTDAGGDVIPICDGRPQMEQEGVAVMAALLPHSQWVSIFHKSLARSGGIPETVLAWQMSKSIPAHDPDLLPFVFLPVMGVMSSVRALGDDKVKLFIMGNKAGAGHTHEDKGSFVLEFAGETFAMDPGTCDYANPLSLTLKSCQRHNMLIPTGIVDRPRPQSPLQAEVKPQGHGDAVRLHAIMDVTPGWQGYYKKWIRTWDSPSPNGLTVTDEYELEAGDGVEFSWNTQQEVEITGNQISLTGKKGKRVITAPDWCSVRVENLPLPGGAVQRRITIGKPGRAGRLEIVATLHGKGGRR